MTETIVVPAGMNGPMENGNGGYSAGLLAAFLAGPARVTLRRPVPLGTPLDVEAEDEKARLLGGGELVAEAESAPDFELEVPDPVSLDEAREAMRDYRGSPDGPFSRCFVCGLGREDSFGVFPGPVSGRPLVATTWRPDPSTAGPDGMVRPEFVWAVLDCPTYFGAYRDDETTVSFLGRITARIDAPVPAAAEHVVIGWPIEVDGRKRQAGSAVLSADGEVLARARALMIEPRA